MEGHALWVWRALGGAHPPFFLLLAQKKEGKEKGTAKAWPALRADYPALLGAKRALRNSLATLGQTVLALIRFPPVVLGCTKGELVLRSRLSPP